MSCGRAGVSMVPAAFRNGAAFLHTLTSPQDGREGFADVPSSGVHLLYLKLHPCGVRADSPATPLLPLPANSLSRRSHWHSPSGFVLTKETVAKPHRELETRPHTYQL